MIIPSKRASLILLTIATLFFYSCASTSSKIDPELSQRLDSIYAEALANPESEDLFTKYCTEEYASVYKESDALAAEQSEVVLGYNLWLNAQDWDKPSMSVSSAEVLSEDNAEAMVNISDLGYDNPVKLILTKVGEQWKIADFQYNYDDTWVSTLEIMESYIEDCQALNE